MNVVILHDEITAESTPDQSDVLTQAKSVFTALTALGYEPTILSMDLDIPRFVEKLKGINPSLVFNLVESINGNGRLIHLAPSLLDYLGVAYTGSRTEAIFTSTNKLVSKKILTSAGITVPQAWWPSKLKTADGAMPPGVYILKPVWEHASVGIDEQAVVALKTMKQAGKELGKREALLGTECFAEQYIEGREFNISLLASPNGVDVLPHAEIRFEDFPPGKPTVVGYKAKWEHDSFEYRHTLRSFSFPKQDAPLLTQLSDLARRCWRVFDVRGYGRVDFRVDKAGVPWVLEVNANPCLSPDAGFAAAAAEAGLTATDVVARIVGDVSHHNVQRSAFSRER